MTSPSTHSCETGKSLLASCNYKLNTYKKKEMRTYLSSSAASSALGLVTVATRLPPSVLLVTDDAGGRLPSISLLTRSWIPTS